MSNIYYDEVEIEDMQYNPTKQIWTYPCPCGDQFILTIDQFNDGEEIAKCPSCSLIIKIIY